LGYLSATVATDTAFCFDCVREGDVLVHHHKPLEHQRRYLYILKLGGGKFYIGPTSDLEMRLREHKDGLTKSTAGKNPRLVFFEKHIGDREALKDDEDYLTVLNKRNPRQIRRIVADWQRLIKLVSIE